MLHIDHFCRLPNVVLARAIDDVSPGRECHGIYLTFPLSTMVRSSAVGFLKGGRLQVL